MPHENQKWLIVFLIYADFRIHPSQPEPEGQPFGMSVPMQIEINLMFEEILTTPIQGGNRLFILINGVRYEYANTQLPSVAHSTWLYEVSESSGAQNQLTLIKSHQGENILQQPDKLLPLLEHIQPAPEEELLFITWNHGSGFGIFRDQRFPFPQSPGGTSLAAVFEKKYPFLQQVWQEMPDRTASNVSTVSSPVSLVPEILRNGELAQVFEAWLKGKKVGVLLMMNCWMMNLHTRYSFRETVHCLVAPTGNIDNPGYNYREIIQWLCNIKITKKTPDLLAQKCIVASSNKAARKRAAKFNRPSPNTIDHWALMAVNLQQSNPLDPATRLIDAQLEALSRAIDALNKRLITNSGNDLRHLLKYSRSFSFDVTKNVCFLVDIVNWMESVFFANSAMVPPSKLLIKAETAIRKFMILSDIAEKTLIERNKAPNYYQTNGAVSIYPPRGCGLFFPHFRPIDNKVVDNFKNDPLMQKFSNWKQLLNNLYGKIVDE